MNGALTTQWDGTDAKFSHSTLSMIVLDDEFNRTLDVHFFSVLQRESFNYGLKLFGFGKGKPML